MESNQIFSIEMEKYLYSLWWMVPYLDQGDVVLDRVNVKIEENAISNTTPGLYGGFTRRQVLVNDSGRDDQIGWHFAE